LPTRPASTACHFRRFRRKLFSTPSLGEFLGPSRRSQGRVYSRSCKDVCGRRGGQAPFSAGGVVAGACSTGAEKGASPRPQTRQEGECTSQGRPATCDAPTPAVAPRGIRYRREALAFV